MSLVLCVPLALVDGLVLHLDRGPLDARFRIVEDPSGGKRPEFRLSKDCGIGRVLWYCPLGQFLCGVGRLVLGRMSVNVPAYYTL